MLVCPQTVNNLDVSLIGIGIGRTAQRKKKETLASDIYGFRLGN